MPDTPLENPLRIIDGLIGHYLEKERIRAGMSIDEVADDLNITPEELQQYETGNMAISAARLFVIGKLFNVSIDRFFWILYNPEGIYENMDF